MNPKKYLTMLIAMVIVVAIGFFIQQPKELSAPSNQQDQEALSTTGSMVSYHDDVQGYLASPEGDGPFPALILIHEWWGLNDNIKDFADRFAQEGYIALAVDLYNGEVATQREDAARLATSVREDLDPAFANLKAAIAFLKNQSTVNPDMLGSVGWCFGGGWSYEIAVNNLGVDASIMYYGQFDPEDDFKNMKAQIQGHFGEEDSSILVDDVKEFASVLETVPGEHAVYIYPNAGHAFANEDNEQAYNPEAAEQAWERTLEFLSTHLK